MLIAEILKEKGTDVFRAAPGDTLADTVRQLDD